MHGEQSRARHDATLAAQCHLGTDRELSDNAARLWTTAQHHVQYLRPA